MVDQHFLSNAAMIVILTSKLFSPEVLMQAGAFVQKLNLSAEYRGLGCTGVGAFYDRDVQKFLNTDNTIVYVSALGEVS
jgi:nitroreductase